MHTYTYTSDKDALDHLRSLIEAKHVLDSLDDADRKPLKYLRNKYGKEVK